MKLSLSSFLLSASWLSQAVKASGPTGNFDYTENLNLAANSSWFAWNRPMFHLLAPNGWMNDPCAAYYDPAIDGYRIYYQYHHAHVHWGNISFAGAKSDDLVFFEDINSWEDPTAIGTDQPYGPAQLGVFSGSALVDGYKGYPTIMYTSVQRLPISWKINYLPLSETQSIAYTPDDGTTWIKLNDINPVIPSPPDDFSRDVTGWRDTLVFRGTKAFHEAIGHHTTNVVTAANEDDNFGLGAGNETSIVSRGGNGLRARALKSDSSDGNSPPEAQEAQEQILTGENGIFTIISSGIKGDRDDAGPKVLLYEAVDAEAGSDKVMTEWNFLGPLFAPAPNTSFSEWSGSYGFNMEMAGYFGLQDGEREMHFITLGTEGGRSDHGDHWPLWVAGDINPDGDSPTLVPEMVGVLDYGEVYAINTFLDKNGSRVMLAWTYEDDNGYGMTARGWQGSLLLPRHLTVVSIENVVTDMSDSEMMQPSDFAATKNDDGSWTVKTLGIQVIPAVVKLRDGANYSTFEATTPEVGYQKMATLATNYFEMQFQIDLSEQTDSKAGVAIRRSEDGSETTSIWYDHQAKAVYVDRSNSSPFEEFNNSTEIAKFRLWETAEEGLEKLNVRLFADGSVVEMYINGRFALTTRIYPSEESCEIGYFTEGGSAAYSEIEVWDGLANAWPSRPADTSIPLVWDGEPYTNYWPGF